MLWKMRQPLKNCLVKMRGKVIDSTRTYGKEELDDVISSGVFQLYKVQSGEMVNKMYGKLHEGELEVIIGAKELDLRFVVMDERAARDLAQMFLLKPIYQQVLKHANEN